MQRLSDASVKRIYAQHPELPAELIEDNLISWLEMDDEPAGASQQQLDELDRLTEKWIDDHKLRASPSVKSAQELGTLDLLRSGREINTKQPLDRRKQPNAISA